ncbi:MAG: DotI/IcmL family type IV secretion protein [Alphaproteobacteria bacterium]|nr:DotI/IcmL family type IV secretion protein [Alphaproteobacteria bacterium]
MRILPFAAVLLAFAGTPALAAEDLLGMYQGYAGDSQLALDQPHRSHAELEDWVSDTVASALTYSSGKTQQKIAELRPLFTEAGFKAYMDFLTSLGFAQDIQAQTLNLSAIVNNAPVLIGQGASSGRYAWAYEMPVVMSTGEPVEGAPQVTKNVTIRLQIGRSAKGVEPHGLLVENWVEKKEEPAATTQDSSGQPAQTP